MNGNNQYALGTFHRPVGSPDFTNPSFNYGFTENNLNWDMHSHGAALGTSGPSSWKNEKGEDQGDLANPRTKDFPNRYILRAGDAIQNYGNIYQYGGGTTTRQLPGRYTWGERRLKNSGIFK